VGCFNKRNLCLLSGREIEKISTQNLGGAKKSKKGEELLDCLRTRRGEHFSAHPVGREKGKGPRATQGQDSRRSLEERSRTVLNKVFISAQRREGGGKFPIFLKHSAKGVKKDPRKGRKGGTRRKKPLQRTSKQLEREVRKRGRVTRVWLPDWGRKGGKTAAGGPRALALSYQHSP